MADGWSRNSVQEVELPVVVKEWLKSEPFRAFRVFTFRLSSSLWFKSCRTELGSWVLGTIVNYQRSRPPASSPQVLKGPQLFGTIRSERIWHSFLFISQSIRSILHIIYNRVIRQYDTHTHTRAHSTQYIRTQTKSTLAHIHKWTTAFHTNR